METITPLSDKELADLRAELTSETQGHLRALFPHATSNHALRLLQEVDLLREQIRDLKQEMEHLQARSSLGGH